MVSQHGISMDPSKVQTILNWQPPGSVCDVQCFLRFANFYCKFIKHYSNIVMHLTELTRKDKSFTWSSNAAEAFENLKKAFTYAPILLHAGLEKPFIIKADASEFALRSILSQVGDDGKLHPIAFHHANSKLRRSIMRFKTKSFWRL